MTAQPVADADAPSNEERGTRKHVRKLLYRSVGVFDWLWLLGRVSGASGDSWLAWTASVPLWTVMAGTISALAVHWALAKDRKTGCLATILFPFYMVALPIVLPLVLLVRTWSVTNLTVKRSQGLAFSLTSYASSVLGAGLVFLGYQQRFLLESALWVLGASLALVITSATTWLFNPFAWLHGFLLWPTKFGASAPDKTQAENRTKFLAAPREESAKFHGLLSAYLGALKGVRTPLGVSADNIDVLLVLGFARKFVVALVHAAFVLGLAAYAITLLGSPDLMFTGLSLSSPSEDWRSFGLYGFLTLVSGESGVLPVSDAARLWVVIAKLTSVCFLVILVATFSILTRERARLILERLAISITDSIARLERIVLELVTVGQAAGVVDAKSRELVISASKFTSLPEAELQQWRGAVGIEQELLTAEAVKAGSLVSLQARLTELDEQQWHQLRATMAESPSSGAEFVNLLDLVDRRTSI